LRILGQKLGDGTLSIIEAPSPALGDLSIRVLTLYSAVSPGTEGSKVASARMSLLQKARSRPDQVKQVLDAARTLGVRSTIRKVRAQLEGATPLGYSLSGRVAETGALVKGFSKGDLVACAGGGYANHADEAVVPVNLAARVPDAVSPAAAAFTTLGAIAMQGVRLAAPQPGDCALVIGLGILGQLACQILRASGCRVFGADISSPAVDLAISSGSADMAAVAETAMESSFREFSRGRGADLVLICAGTSSNSPVELAGRLARQKGRVVVVGAVGLAIPREIYYRKEIAFSISCSYGPGRYDPSYEEGGLDYPMPYVRWTEQRNMEAVLDLMARGAVDPLLLITHRVRFDSASEAYSLIAERTQPFCGILLEYPPKTDEGRTSRVELPSSSATAAKGTIGVGFFGSGSFAQSFLLPSLREEKRVSLSSICTRTGLSASDIGARYGFRSAVDSLDALLEDPATQAVVIAARHDIHASATLRSLSSGRHVFVEKPLCILREDLGSIARLALATGASLPVLQVGFNRRFSPSARAVRNHFAAGPVSMVYRINAGRIARDSWIQDPVQGGGRILGEVCHFVDLLQFLSGSEPTRVSAACLKTEDASAVPEDSLSVTIEFANGSIGSLAYLAEGCRALPKERVEVHGAGRSAVIDNFLVAELYDGPKGRKRRHPGKGYSEELGAFVDSMLTGRPAIPLRSLLATTETTFCILDSLRSGGPVPVDVDGLFRP
jgi:predicted dehydrogenase/threonine dehydrogenase-like Zn-dependent dehydrogenase